MAERVKKRLGEILIEDGSLTPENLEEALNHQKKEGGIIGQILIKLGYITEEKLIAAVGKQLRVPYLPLSHYSVNMETGQQFGHEFSRKNMIVAFDQDDKRVYLAMADPLNDLAVEEIEKKTGLRAQVFISTPSEIHTMLDLMYNSNLPKKELKKAV